MCSDIFGLDIRVYGRVKVRVNIRLGLGFRLFFYIIGFGVKDLILISMVWFNVMVLAF